MCTLCISSLVFISQSASNDLLFASVSSFCLCQYAEKLSKGAGYVGRFVQGTFKGCGDDWPDFPQEISIWKGKGEELTVDVENISLEKASRKKMKEEVSYRDHHKRKYSSI